MHTNVYQSIRLYGVYAIILMGHISDNSIMEESAIGHLLIGYLYVLLYKISKQYAIMPYTSCHIAFAYNNSEVAMKDSSTCT